MSLNSIIALTSLRSNLDIQTGDIETAKFGEHSWSQVRVQNPQGQFLGYFVLESVSAMQGRFLEADKYWSLLKCLSDAPDHVSAAVVVDFYAQSAQVKHPHSFFMS